MNTYLVYCIGRYFSILLMQNNEKSFEFSPHNKEVAVLFSAKEKLYKKTPLYKYKGVNNLDMNTF